MAVEIIPGGGYDDLLKAKTFMARNPSMPTIDGVIAYKNPEPVIEIDEDYFVAVEKGSFMPYFVLFPKGKQNDCKSKIIVGCNSKLIPRGTYIVGLPTIKNVLEHYRNPEYFHIYMNDIYSPFGQTVGYFGADGQGPEQVDFFEYPFQFSVSRFYHRNEEAKICFKLKKSFEDVLRAYANGGVYIRTAFFYFERLLNYYEQNRGSYVNLPGDLTFAGGDTTGIQFGNISMHLMDRYACYYTTYFTLVGDALGIKTDLPCHGGTGNMSTDLDFILFVQLYLRNGQETGGANVINPSYISGSMVIDFNGRVSP